MLVSSKSQRKAPVAAVVLLGVLFSCCYNLRGADALYFYLHGIQQRCFIQELSRETTVFGEYRAEEWADDQKSFVSNVLVGVQTTVEEMPQRHMILNQKGGPTGKFSFTAAESGDHSVCMTANSSGWYPKSKVRVHISMHIGEEESATAHEEGTMSELSQMVRDLNNRMTDIHREQGYLRETEAKFRDHSENTNSKVVYWAVCQLLILAGTCFWQMKHLKNFFEAKKLV